MNNYKYVSVNRNITNSNSFSFPFTIQAGNYILTAPNTFFIGEIKYLIRDRKSPRAGQPKQFISAFQGKQHYYVSSLYPQGDNIYQFDNKQNRYIMKIIDKSIIIIEQNKG